MASSGKKKTTMAKLTRESKLRERRVEKKARKEARKLAAAQGLGTTEDEFAETPDASALLDGEQPARVDGEQPARVDGEQPARVDGEQPALEAAGQTLRDA